MTCLHETDALCLLSGTLKPNELRRIDAHLDQCRHCRTLVADLARARSSTCRPPNSEASAREPPAEADTDVDGDRAALDPGRRYVMLGFLAQGGMGHVHRALDRLTGKIVALKHVPLRAAGEDPAALAGSVEALTQEFRTLATLRHPNIISVLDYGIAAGHRPYFTMELLHGAEPVLPFAWSAPPAVQMDLLAQLLRALGYLHRRGVLHRDLKPSNILILRGAHGAPGLDAAGAPLLKVLDFGLSTGTNDLNRFQVAGTFPYMAPEVLRGEASSEASDLYAAGVVACEVLARRHPFAGWTTTAELTRKVLADPPDLGALPPPLQRALGRTLAKLPASRPADSGALLREIVEATGISIPDDPAPVRDSYLVAAKLVGRDQEMEELRHALDEARRGRGSAWLVGGESGAGKSRLLDELRSVALVQGALVAEGQAIPSGGTAYSLWRGVLSILALNVELSDPEASVLGTILPHLDALLEREVVPPPELDVQGARHRLLRVLGDVVARSRDPVLLLFEDLQWADPESLALLAQVSAGAGGRPLLVTASYRDDEAPGLRAALPAMRALRLPRLERRSIARLCESMVGPAGRDDRLISLVARETEGNPYFIVEVMRALAEEAGGLADVGRRGLPERILAGGVQRMLDRRLARAPAEARALLRLAAVAGRQLDLDVLSAREPRLGELVQACADAGVLAMREERWRFEHDKLRERVLAELSPPELRALHAQVAESLLETYPRSFEHAASIAHHFREAGRPSDAARFYALAGEGALARGAPGEAELMLEQAIALQAHAPQIWHVRQWRRLAEARFALGRLSGTDAALRQLCAHAGVPLPSSALGWCRAMAKQVAVQAAWRSGLARHLPIGPRDEADRTRSRELLIGLTLQEVYVWLGEPPLSLLCTLWGTNLEEALGAGRDAAHRAGLAFLLSYTPLLGLAQRYLDEAARAAPPGSRAEIDCRRIQSMIWLHQGRRSRAAECAEQAVTLARASGDERMLLHCLLQLQLAAAALDDFERMRTVCYEMEPLAIAMQNPCFTLLAQMGQGIAELLFGRLAEAEATLDRALASVGEGVGPALEAVALGLGAQCALEQGQHALAEERARAALEAVRRSRWAMQELRYALTGALNVFLAAERPERHDARIQEALGRLRGLARRFPSAESNAWMFEGRNEMRLGRPSRAAPALRRSLRAASRIGSTCDRANAHYWLGRLAETPGGRPHVPEGAAVHFEAAHALFARQGVALEAERARAAWRSSRPPDPESDRTAQAWTHA